MRWHRSSAVRAARKRGWASRPRRPRGLSRAASSARATVSSARFTSSATARAWPIQWSAACRDQGSRIPAPNPAAKRDIRSASSPIAAPAGCRYSGGATSMLTAMPTSAPRIASSTRASPSDACPADLQQQHGADRRLEQVRAEPQHLADHDRAGDDGAEAPPGQSDEVGHEHGDRHPGEHTADAAQAVRDALVEGQLDDQQRHQRRDDRVLGQVQDLGEQVGGHHGERHLGGAQAGRAAAAEERGTDAVGATSRPGDVTCSSSFAGRSGRAWRTEDVVVRRAGVSGPSRVDGRYYELTIPITESCQRAAL